MLDALLIDTWVCYSKKYMQDQPCKVVRVYNLQLQREKLHLDREHAKYKPKKQIDMYSILMSFVFPTSINTLPLGRSTVAKLVVFDTVMESRCHPAAASEIATTGQSSQDRLPFLVDLWFRHDAGEYFDRNDGMIHAF